MSSVEKKRSELAGQLQAIIEGLIPEEKVKNSLSGDKTFMESLSREVLERLVAEGYVEDRLLDQKEAMKLLGIKSIMTLNKLRHNKKNALIPIRLHPNGHPKYRTSDINRYIRGMKKDA